MEYIGKSLIVLLLALTLSSCAWVFKKPPVVVTESRLIPVTPPAVMFKGCNIPPPPDKETYMKGDLNYRLGSMLRYNARLVTTIKRCDATIKAIEQWQAKQATIIRSKPPK